MLPAKELPARFPLYENRDFLSEREWVCLRLICHTADSIADADPLALAEATAHQIGPERAARLVEMARIARLPGLGSWISRLLVDAGIDSTTIRTLSADEIVARVNQVFGYPICNPATASELAQLQATWADLSGSTTH